MGQHAVIVDFVDFGKRFFTMDSNDLTALFDFEDDLEAAVEATGAGVLDGHEIAVDGSHGQVYLYGPDAEALFRSVQWVLEQSPVAKGGKVTLRFGDADKQDVRKVVRTL